MFEEEKEIRLHDFKRFRYLKSYGKNIIRYRNKKVSIPTLEIWGSGQCNLKCKECMNRIPFVRQVNMDTEKILSGIDILCKLANVRKVIISGGEPFLNKELYKLVLRIQAVPEVEKIYIFTNGTVMPDEKLISTVSMSPKPVTIVINEYQSVTNQIQEIKKILKNRGILYRVRKLGSYQWNGIGNDIVRPLHFETARMIYAECRMRKYAVLYEDILTKCPRGVMVRHSFFVFPQEYLDISKLKNNVLSRAKLACCLDSEIHKEYCRLCFGLSEENPYLDEPGIQLKRCDGGEKNEE